VKNKKSKHPPRKKEFQTDLSLDFKT